MKNIRMPKALQLAGLLAGPVLLGLWLYDGCSAKTLEEMGMHGHPNGDTLYLEGESCTINTGLTVSEAQILDRAAWCATWHRKTLERQTRTPTPPGLGPS
jgi:hypothetical protein